MILFYVLYSATQKGINKCVNKARNIFKNQEMCRFPQRITRQRFPLTRIFNILCQIKCQSSGSIRMGPSHDFSHYFHYQENISTVQPLPTITQQLRKKFQNSQDRVAKTKQVFFFFFWQPQAEEHIFLSEHSSASNPHLKINAVLYFLLFSL